MRNLRLTEKAASEAFGKIAGIVTLDLDFKLVPFLIIFIVEETGNNIVDWGKEIRHAEKTCIKRDGLGR